MALTAFFLLCGCTTMDEGEDLYPDDTRNALGLLDVCPKSEANDVSTNVVIQLLFDKDLNPDTVNESSVMLGTGRWHVKGIVSYADHIVSYLPSRSLEPNTRYDFYITSDLRDADGFALVNNVKAWSFTTGDPGLVTCR